MNRYEELMTKKGAELIAIAIKHEINVNTNKERTQLKESKKSVVEKIVKHEEIIAKAIEEAKKNEAPKKARKNAKMYEYNGKRQSMVAWAKELGMPTSTLYNRLITAGLSVEEAFTRPVKERK